jgi:hypothetical protein
VLIIDKHCHCKQEKITPLLHFFALSSKATAFTRYSFVTVNNGEHQYYGIGNKYFIIFTTPHFCFVIFVSGVYTHVSANFMKNILYIFILTTLSCNNQSKQTEKTTIAETTNQLITISKTDNSKYYTTKDTILITNEIGETLEFSKQVFNNIIDNHPEFFNAYKEYGYPQDPDQAYYCNTSSIEFSSEVGQDNYYILYAYFLKQKNGVKEYAKQREKLIDIYSNINSLFGYFQYGGTYFGHQSRRILGYAEYSIYLLPKSKEDFEKTYDITGQKTLYIKSLRQLIDDESKIDNETLGKEKIKRTKELNKIVDDLDKLITDNFYLRRAQEFHYEHYEYY